jgi:NAD(P)-dependent dehydrogenase (short-subunit alcohol dehydrogenase family)
VSGSPATEAFDFAGQVVVMTGAASGIGRLSAVLFAQLGADLLLVDRDEDGLAETATQVTALGRRAVVQSTDVRDADQCEAAIEAAVSALGRIDVLVNCAGGSRARSYEDTTLADFDAMIALNLRAPWVLSRAATPHLRTSRGSIVNISSMASLTAVSHSVPYGAAKAGLNNLTMSMAAALRDRAVRVNGVALGSIKTEGWVRAMTGMGIDPEVAYGGPPDDVAWAVVVLASRACSFMSGVTIPLTGGVGYAPALDG